MKIQSVLLALLLLLVLGGGLLLGVITFLGPSPAGLRPTEGAATADTGVQDVDLQPVLDRLTAVERNLEDLRRRLDAGDRPSRPRPARPEVSGNGDLEDVATRLAELELRAGALDARVAQVESERPLSLTSEESLVGLLEDISPVTRRRALHELRRRRSKLGVEAAIRFASDPDELVRESVADYFEDVPDPRGQEALVLLAHDPVNEVADAAVDAIAARGDAAAVAALEDLYRTVKDPRVAYAAGRNRVRLGRENQELPPFRPPMDRWCTMLEDASPRNRETAVYALRVFGNEADISLLEDLRHDPDLQVRRAVVRTLREWGVEID
jgi:HEAT repeat protein